MENPYAYTSWSSSEPSRKSKVAAWIDCLSHDLVLDSEDADARDSLKELCRIVISRTKAWKDRPVPSMRYGYRQQDAAPFSDDDISRIMVSCIYLDLEDLILDAIHVGPVQTTVLAWQSLGKSMVRYGIDRLVPMLTVKVEAIVRLADRLPAIYAIQEGQEMEAQISMDDMNTNLCRPWAAAAWDSAIQTAVVDCSQDGMLLSNLGAALGGQDIFNKILLVVKRNMSITPMAVAFATGILEKGKNVNIPEATAKEIFHDVVADLADSFSLHTLGKPFDEVAKRSVSLYSRYQASAPAEPAIDIENSTNIANLLCNCQSLVLEKQIDVANSPFQKLFQYILATYLHRYVGDEPQPPKDWARARVGCSCGDCRILNNFLSNPEQQVGRIAVALKRRGHLHTQIEATHPTFTHVTERVGSPQTLVVTKTNVAYQTQHKNWQARREVAKKHIEELGHEDLKVFLGGLHQRIISLSVKTPAQPTRLPTVQGSGPSVAPALATSVNASNRVLPLITKRNVPQTQQFIVIDDSD